MQDSLSSEHVARVVTSTHRQIGDGLPNIPEKRYFTISEVAYLCQIKPHVLRYWEQEFSHLKPVKRRGNRRYYRYDDVKAVRTIRQLLYVEGYTIAGAKARLVGKYDDGGESPVTLAEPVSNQVHKGDEYQQLLGETIKELEDIHELLKRR